jgi:hypothetical protein
MPCQDFRQHALSGLADPLKGLVTFENLKIY